MSSTSDSTTTKSRPQTFYELKGKTGVTKELHAVQKPYTLPGVLDICKYPESSVNVPLRPHFINAEASSSKLDALPPRLQIPAPAHTPNKHNAYPTSHLDAHSSSYPNSEHPTPDAGTSAHRPSRSHTSTRQGGVARTTRETPASHPNPAQRARTATPRSTASPRDLALASANRTTHRVNSGAPNCKYTPKNPEKLVHCSCVLGAGSGNCDHAKRGRYDRNTMSARSGSSGVAGGSGGDVHRSGNIESNGGDEDGYASDEGCLC